MKFYNSVGPNPRVVRMFMHEKGIEVPQVEVDLMGAENRETDYLKVNVAGQCPAMELDNGKTISEITVLCEYLEEKNPEPVLIGSNPEQRAETRMWLRRVDLGICEPLANGFRFGEGIKFFENRVLCRPEASDGLKAIAQNRIEWLDGLMAGKNFIAGDRFSLADIHLYCFLDFGTTVGQPLNEENKNIMGWFERVKARPSAVATA